MFDDLIYLDEPVLTDARLDRVFVNAEAGTDESLFAAIFVDELFAILAQCHSKRVDHRCFTVSAAVGKGSQFGRQMFQQLFRTVGVEFRDVPRNEIFRNNFARGDHEPATVRPVFRVDDLGAFAFDPQRKRNERAADKTSIGADGVGRLNGSGIRRRRDPVSYFRRIKTQY